MTKRKTSRGDGVGDEIVITWPAYDASGVDCGGLLTQAGFALRMEPRTGERSAAQMVSVVSDAVGAIASTDPFDEVVFSACPRLRVIARTGVGYDAIDVAAATDAGVAVTITPGANEEAVADHTLALMLSIRRLLATNDAEIRFGRWERTGPHVPPDLYSATVGLIGCGAIGRAVIRRLSAFGARVLVSDPYLDAPPEGARLVDLATLLGSSDIVSVHASLNETTRGMIGPDEFAAMRPGATFVNVARGGLVVEDALADALESGHLAGAGIDTFENEPPRDSRLLHLPTAVLSPHIAGMSIDSIRRMNAMATESVLAVLAGQRPDTCINPDVFSP